MKKNCNPEKKTDSKVLLISNGAFNLLFSVVLTLLISYPFFRIFGADFISDDWEHILSSWFIYNGYEPYGDFFQHHHPLLWYTLTPLFFFVEYPEQTFWAARSMAALFFVGDCLLIGLIIKRLSGTDKDFLWALLIYLSYPLSHALFIEVRPDGFMRFFMLLGVFYWLEFYKSQKTKDLVLCYLSLFVSFAFLQKALLFLVPFGGYQLYLLCGKKLEWKKFLYAITIPVLFTFSYFLYLWHKGLFIRYWELNWILNFYWFRDFRNYTFNFFDYLYVFLCITYLLYCIVKTQGLIRQLSIVLFIFFMIFLSVSKPFLYYWLMWTPFAGIILGAGTLRIKRKYIRNILLFLFLINAVSVVSEIKGIEKEPDIEKYTQEVKEIRDSGEECVGQSTGVFSLLNKKPDHYYWMELSQGAIWDRDLFHRYNLPELDKIILKKKPKYIIPTTIYNAKYKKLGETTEVIMKTDPAFLKAYYRPIGSVSGIWKRIEK